MADRILLRFSQLALEGIKISPLDSQERKRGQGFIPSSAGQEHMSYLLRQDLAQQNRSRAISCHTLCFKACRVRLCLHAP